MLNCPVEVCNPEINPQNNRLIGYNFDAAGNTIQDAEGRQFVYDGENKQVEVKNSQNQVIGKYYFDGDGQSIKKIVPAGVNGGTGETTVFVYDASAKLVAEYSTVVEPQSTAKISYLTSDHLGSPRILTDQNGAVISRRDFMPFGEEITSGTGGRTTAQGYVGADSIRQKFTGYERDTETDLDFAQARMYRATLASFTTVDSFGPWPMTEEEKAEFLSLPQRWNRFVYVSGNPLKYTDPTGLYICDNTVTKQQCEQIDKGLKALRDKGTDEQKKFATWLLDKNNKTVFTIGSTASVFINDVKGANDLIQKGNATVNEASKFITISLSKTDISSGKDFGTEPILAHEGRHAWVAADVITSFSNGDSMNSDITRFENEFQAHYSAALYLRKQGGAYVQWGLTDPHGHLKTENGSIKVDAQSIRNKLASVYKDDATGSPLTEKNPGYRVSQIYGLKPKK